MELHYGILFGVVIKIIAHDQALKSNLTTVDCREGWPLNLPLQKHSKESTFSSAITLFWIVPLFKNHPIQNERGAI